MLETNPRRGQPRITQRWLRPQPKTPIAPRRCTPRTTTNQTNNTNAKSCGCLPIRVIRAIRGFYMTTENQTNVQRKRIALAERQQRLSKPVQKPEVAITGLNTWPVRQPGDGREFVVIEVTTDANISGWVRSTHAVCAAITMRAPAPRKRWRGFARTPKPSV